MSTKTSKSEETQERILEAALKLFSEQGYSATATSQIAAEAEVAEGTVFKYFPKKMDLLRRTLYRFLDKYSAQIVLSPLEKLFEDNKDAAPDILMKAIIKDRLKMIDKMGPLITVILTEMQYHEEIRQIFMDRILINGVDYGERVIEHFIKRGYFRDVPPMIAFRNFMGSVGIMILQKKFAAMISKEDLSLEDEIDLLIDLFFNGISNKGAIQNEQVD